MLTAAPSGSRMKGLKAQQKRRRSIIEDRRERLSESFQASPGASALLTTDPESSIPRELSQAELRDSFDEWMKIVADNVMQFHSYAYSQTPQT